MALKSHPRQKAPRQVTRGWVIVERLWMAISHHRWRGALCFRSVHKHSFFS